jgi:heme O synthase-like polyprenyltransferase
MPRQRFWREARRTRHRLVQEAAQYLPARSLSNAAARRLLMASIIYLPLVFLLLVLDKL